MRLTGDNYVQVLRLFTDYKQGRIRDMNARIAGEKGITSMNPRNNVLSPAQVWAKGQAGAFMGLSFDDAASLVNPNHIRGMDATNRCFHETRRIIDLPEGAREALITFAREDFTRNFGGSRGSVDSGTRQAMLQHSFLRQVPEQDRLAASWTMQQIRGAESERIQNALREAIPNWQIGQRVPDNILRPILNGHGGNVNAVV
ncbi:MAG: DUF3879 family protein [Defluviitaleaceae bacterium]|nr:DUF3879 family protein [Defluviitaleaceae bacterium]MCL2274030.1 DUF3879 family protein [Defluviitaleaceae bacterium]MCL2274069.1 DUF3879 family protein [Defluviitaleaceae bacterium]